MISNRDRRKIDDPLGKYRLSRIATSRNLKHYRAIGKLKELLGDKPMVMDQEFSYEGLLAASPRRAKVCYPA